MSRLSKFKKFLIFAAILAWFGKDGKSQIAIYVISGPNLPANCSVKQGSVYFKTVGGAGVEGLYQCGPSDNTWKYVGTSGGGTGNITINGTTIALGGSGNANWTSGSLISGDVATWNGTSGQLQDGGSPGVPTATVATLPASPSGNPTYLVTDSAFFGDCITGGDPGGLFDTLCSFDGSWFPPGATQAFYYQIENSGSGSGLNSEPNLNFLSGGCVDNPTHQSTDCRLPNASGSITSGHLATWSSTTSTMGTLVDGGAVPVSPTANQNTRTIGAVLTPTALTACVYVPFAGVINAFHAVSGDGATVNTVHVQVETQPTFATFISTGVSGASDISSGGEALSSVLGKVDTLLTSWTTTLTAGTTVCFVASSFSAGTSVNANITVAAN